MSARLGKHHVTYHPGTPRGPNPQLPLVIYVLTAVAFLMGTTELVVAGMLTEVASGFNVTTARAGLSITVFAAGMIIGAPMMALLTSNIPRRVTLVAALSLYAIGHLLAAATEVFEIMLAARFLTALGAGAFWAVGSVMAAQTVGPEDTSRALGLVLGGGRLASIGGVPLGSLGGQMVGWRGTFWVLAMLAVIAAVAVASLIPSSPPGRATSSTRAELRALLNGRLWLALAICALINAGVLSIYSYISPLMVERAGLPVSIVPVALMLFGLGALVGTAVGGRLGNTRPFTTTFVTAGVTILAAGGIWAFSNRPAALLALFTLLGLVGLSANPILVSLAIRYGGKAPTLAGAMPTAMFNLGTAAGTGITGAALESGLGVSAPPMIGTISASLVLVPLGVLALLERRVTHGQRREPAAVPSEQGSREP